MMDKDGTKFLLIRFSPTTEGENPDSDWSLVEDNDEFAYTNWFKYSDFEVYRPYQIKEKFYSKTTKLSEKKLINDGYLKVVGKTYEWAYNWFFELIEMNEIERYFSELNGAEKEEKFWLFIKMTGIREELYTIEDYLRLDLAKQWCHLHKINYKIDVPEDYPQELPKTTLRRIKDKIKSTHYSSPFEFLNEII